MSASTHDPSLKAADLASARLSKDTAGRVATLGFAAAGLGLLVTIGSMFSETLRDQALYSYLVAFFFVATIAVGGLFFTILQHLVGAQWSVVVRRLSEIM